MARGDSFRYTVLRHTLDRRARHELDNNEYLTGVGFAEYPCTGAITQSQFLLARDNKSVVLKDACSICLCL